jgi:hypothetical protein
MRSMMVQGARFSFRFAPDISDEEWAEMAHVLCKIIVCGKPQTPKHRRAVAVRQALGPLGPYRCHAAIYRRAAELERRYGEYLGDGWKRERIMANLPEPCSLERRLLHRLANANEGRPLRWRQLLRIAGPL